MDTIELGDMVQDKISGFKGIANSLAKCLTGCDRVEVVPNKLNKEGKLADGYWFDEYQLKVVKRGVIRPATVQEPKKKTNRKVGGPPAKSTLN